jgi:hypothetical protein
MKTVWPKVFSIAAILLVAVAVAFVIAKNKTPRPRQLLTERQLSSISDPFEKTKAVFAAVTDLLTKDSEECGNRLPTKKEMEEENKKIEELYGLFWQQAPVGIIIQPAHSTNGSSILSGRKNQIVEMNVPFTTLFGVAYRTNGNYFSAKRMVFAAKMPDGHFDLLLNDTNQDDGSLKSEISKQFNLKGRLELRETNVLVIKLKNRGAPALKFGAMPAYDHLKSFPTVLTTSQLAKTLEERFFPEPVFDETRLSGTIYYFALPHDSKELDLLKQTLLEQSGLELVSERRPIEMLIMEKAN